MRSLSERETVLTGFLVWLILVLVIMMAVVWPLGEQPVHRPFMLRHGVSVSRSVATQPVPKPDVAKAVIEKSTEVVATKPVARSKTTEAMPRTYTPVPGDTLGARFPKDWERVCDLNRRLNGLRDCGLIPVKKPLLLPDGVEARVKTKAKIPVAHHAMHVPTTETSVFYWRKVGGAPLKGCGGRDADALNEEAWQVLGLTDTERSELRARIALGQSQLAHLLPGDHYRAVAFCEKGKVSFKQNVVAAWLKDLAVWGDQCVLSTGRVLVHVWNCGNWVEGKPETPQATVPAPEVVAQHRMPVEEATSSKPVVASPQKIACDEWNVRASAGAERSVGSGTDSAAVYADAEIGACPFAWEGKGGVFHELVLAGRVHSADDQFHDWDGTQRTLLAGIGLRRSYRDGSGDLHRLMLGMRESDGAAGSYAHDARWLVGGAFGTYYSVQPDGSDETHYRWGLILPIGGAKGHASLNGVSTDLPKYNGSVEVGVRRYLDKQGEEYRRFIEANASIVSPDYQGVGLRAGVCNESDTLCGLAGVNIGLDPTGASVVLGVQVNTPGIVRITRDGIRAERIAQAALVNGVKFRFVSDPR